MTLNKLVVAALLFSIMDISPATAAPTKVGATCPKPNAKTYIASKQLVCKKKGSKLVWQIKVLQSGDYDQIQVQRP